MAEASLPSFNITAGTDTVAFSSSNRVNNLNFTGFAGTLGIAAFSCYGNFIRSVGMTVTLSANIITFAATSGTKTITSNGQPIDRVLVFSGVGGTWQLADALSSTGGIIVADGTLNTLSNAVNASIVNFWPSIVNLAASTVTVAVGGVLIHNLLSSASAATIILTDVLSSLEGPPAPDTITWGPVTLLAGAGAQLNIYGTNVFGAALTLTDVNITVYFEFSSTHTFQVPPSLDGAVGQLNRLWSDTGGFPFFLDYTGIGTLSFSYLDIMDSHATPASPPTWIAADGTSINNGGNAGWFFGGGGGSAMMLMRALGG